MTERLQLPTLLAISDNPSIFHWIKKNLDEQYNLIEAPTEKIALEMARSTALDFIILDSLFEEIHPLELSRKLRQINPAIPIFLITGRLKKSFCDAAIESGVTDFLNDQLSIEEIEMRAAACKKSAIARKKTSETSSQLKNLEQSYSSDFIKNKVLLNEKALRLLDEMKKKKDSITLLLIRIDRFNELKNAEMILPSIQKLLTQVLHLDDLLIPASNGTFVVLLPHTTAKDTHEIAEKMQSSIHQNVFNLPNQPTHLTISIVVSPLEANEMQYKKLVNLANQTLDEEKTMANLILFLDPKKQ